MRRQLTPAATYYIRKLLQQHLNQLTFSVVDSTGQKADTTTNLTEILASLYVKVPKIESVMGELERLVQLHRSLNQASIRDDQDLEATAAQIFGLLGCEVKAIERSAQPQTGSAQQRSTYLASSNTTLRKGTDASIGTILVVDAEPTSRQLMTHALTYHNYRVVTAADGEDAIGKIRDLRASAVLMDVVLPDMNGYMVCERLKASPLTQDIPVLFVSAIQHVGTKIQAFEMGGADYLTKPFAVEEMLARVSYHVTIYHRQRHLENQVAQFKQKALGLPKPEPQNPKARP